MVQTNEPRTAQQALHLARRHERAQTLLQQGYTFTPDRDTNTVFVCKPGRLYAEYTIGEQLTGRDGCSCDDFQRNAVPCKHMLCWQLILNEKADEDAHMEAICQEYDEAEGFLDRIPTPTLESLAAKDLYQKMSADLQRVEMAIHTHGTRRVNYLQAQQDRDKANRLENALMVVARYRTEEPFDSGYECGKDLADDRY